MQTNDDINTFVVDFGSCLIKSDLCDGMIEDITKHEPLVTYTISGRQKLQAMSFIESQKYMSYDVLSKNMFYGDDVYRRDQNVSLCLPIQEKGFVVDWDAYSGLLQQIIKKPCNQRGFSFSDMKKRLALTENYTQQKQMAKQRNKIIETVFEQFDFDEFAFLDQASNILTQEGRQTGLVVDIGDTSCWAQTVCEGVTLPTHCYNEFPISGRNLSSLLSTSLSVDTEKGITKKFMTSTRKHRAAYQIKGEACATVTKTQSIIPRDRETRYKLPGDDTFIINSNACLEVGEMLFKGVEDKYAVQNMVFDTYSKSPLDFQKYLANNIILSGGTTCLHLFDERLAEELKSLD